MSTVPVKLNFTSGAINYDLPVVQSITDNEASNKSVLIEGNRADGSIYISGGKKSVTLNVKGVLINHNGYISLMSDRSTMITNLTTASGTLTLKYYSSGIWSNSWSYTVRRVGEIRFNDNKDMRTDYLEYEVDFLILSY